MAAKTSPSRRRTAELCGSDDGPEFDACDYKKGLLLGKYRFLLEAAKQVRWTRWLVVLALLLVTSAAVYLSYGDDVDLRDLVDTRVPADYVPPKTKGKVRLGIVLKTKDPIAIHDWLRHHQNLGVERVYMRIEDTPGLAAEMNKSEFANMLSISVKPPSGPKVKYKNVFNAETIIAEQSANLVRVIPEARKDGLTHLAHIDDDELLYFPSGKEAFYAELSQYDQFSGKSSMEIRTLEAVYGFSNCVSPFNTTTHFCTSPMGHGSYWGYKAIGNLWDPYLRPRGPHFFQGEAVYMKPHVAVLLHYEGACLPRWMEKFNQSPEQREKSMEMCKADTWQADFDYYCDSVAAFAKNPDSPNAEVWREYKLKEKRKEETLVAINPFSIWEKQPSV